MILMSNNLGTIKRFGGEGEKSETHAYKILHIQLVYIMSHIYSQVLLFCLVSFMLILQLVHACGNPCSLLLLTPVLEIDFMYNSFISLVCLRVKMVLKFNFGRMSGLGISLILQHLLSHLSLVQTYNSPISIFYTQMIHLLL